MGLGVPDQLLLCAEESLLGKQGHRRPSGRCGSGVSHLRRLLRKNSPLSSASLREAHAPFRDKQVASVRANFHTWYGEQTWRHGRRNCQGSGAQGPREFLGFGTLATWQPDHRGCLVLWAHPYLAGSQGLSSSTLASLKSIIWVHPQHLENIWQ